MKLTYRVVPAACLILASMPREAVSQASPIGWSYTMNMSINSGDALRRSSVAIRQQVIASKARMEFVQISGLASADNAEGMSIIANALDSTITMVMPKDRTATVMNIAMMLSSRIVPPKFERHYTKTDVEDLGAGDRSLGHATHHVRVVNAGTIDVTVLGKTCSGSLNSVSEMWIAPDVDVHDAMSAMGKTFSAAFGIGDGTDANSVGPASLPKGTPLRTVTKVTKPDSLGKMTTVTTTTEYVELARGPLDPSLFAAPPDFHVMDMRAIMSQLPPGMLDSAIKAGAAQGAKAGAKAACRSVGAP